MAADLKLEPLHRVTVSLDGATARALAEDATARMIPIAEVVRQAIAFDIAARGRAATALADAMAERGAAAQRLAQLLATPTAGRCGRRLDAVSRAARHATVATRIGDRIDAVSRSINNCKGKPSA